ncbi:hypothetical protein HDU91_006580 [Kappamyces sp. JEL0680]|nr:hypothetical protein HDU91_006580 [Kappamyces sp. JEL0680]
MVKIIYGIATLDKDVLANVPSKLYVESGGSFVSIVEHAAIENSSRDSRIVLSLLGLLLAHKASRIALSDSNALCPLLTAELALKMVHSETPDEQKFSMLCVSCLENAALDSAVRFKLKESGLFFFLELIKHTVRGLRSSSFLDKLLTRALKYVNEYHGHDPDSLQKLCQSAALDHRPLVFALVSVLEDCVSTQLRLDLPRADDASHSADCALAIAHVIDSVLRSQLGREMFVTTRQMGRLTLIAKQIDHPEIPSVVIKFIARILTDPNMTLRDVSNFAYLDVFAALMDSFSSNDPLLAAVESALAIYRPDLVPTLMSLLDYGRDDREIKLSVALALGFVAPFDFISFAAMGTAAQVPLFPRSKSIELWMVLLESDSAHMHLLFKYIGSKVSGTHKYFKNGSIIALDSSLLQLLLTDESSAVWLQPSSQAEQVLLQFPDKSLCCSKQLLVSSSPVFEMMLRDGSAGFLEGKTGAVVINDSRYEDWIPLLAFLHQRKSYGGEVEFQQCPTSEHLDRIFSLLQLAKQYLFEDAVEAIKQWIADASTFFSLSSEQTLLKALYFHICDAPLDIQEMHELKETVIRAFVPAL